METTKPSKPMPLSGKLLKLMEQQNKPLTSNVIHDQMGKEINKKTVQSNIDLLVAQGHLIEKTNGKSKIYCVNNKRNQANGEAQMLELRTLNEKIAKYSKSIHEAQLRVKTIESQLKTATDDVPLPILQARHDVLTESVGKLKSRADEIKHRDGPKLDPKEFAELQQKRAKKLQEVVKLKRMCMNLIDGIMEGYPKSKLKLIEDTEIETDEAAGFDINQYN